MLVQKPTFNVPCSSNPPLSPINPTLLSCTWYATHPKNATDHTRRDKKRKFQLNFKIKIVQCVLRVQAVLSGECRSLYIDNRVGVKDHSPENQ